MQNRLLGVLTGFLLATGTLGAAEHQRVGQSIVVEHRWETGLGVAVIPLGPQDWIISLGPRLSYEYDRTWSLALSAARDWTAKTGTPGVRARWSSLTADLGWVSEGQEPRWRLGVGASVLPWAEAPPEVARVTGDLGVSWVRDPAILSVSGSVSAPVVVGQGSVDQRGWVGSLAFAFQEVVNDNLVWSFTAAPRVGWNPLDRTPGGPRLAWSLGVTWGTAWFDGPWSLSAGAAAGSGAPWSLQASGGRSW